ncbi:MAG: hypothetical protein NTV49_13005 [Kiritimatiellaeota bacterium]|nr:hypothetical protein [Kiritimatiellota bacterium]
MRKRTILLLWPVTAGLFFTACLVQQTWFRAHTPIRPLFYGVEAFTCILLLLAGLEAARPHRTRFDFNAGISALLGGIASVLAAGVVVSLFLRPQCPNHGEWSLFFFIIPGGLLAIVAPIYWTSLVIVEKMKLGTANKASDATSEPAPGADSSAPQG